MLVVPPGNTTSAYKNAVSVSGDGRFVAFDSFATDLAPGGGSSVTNVFVRDAVDLLVHSYRVDDAVPANKGRHHRVTYDHLGRATSDEGARSGWWRSTASRNAARSCSTDADGSVPSTS